MLKINHTYKLGSLQVDNNEFVYPLLCSIEHTNLSMSCSWHWISCKYNLIERFVVVLMLGKVFITRIQHCFTQHTFLPISHCFQICDVENEAEKISPDEEAEKPDGNKTSGMKKNDNRDTDKPDQKQQETTTKVKTKQSERGYLI